MLQLWTDNTFSRKNVKKKIIKSIVCITLAGVIIAGNYCRPIFLQQLVFFILQVNIDIYGLRKGRESRAAISEG